MMLPAPGRIIVVTLSSRRRRRNPTIKTAIARPVTGSQPREPVRVKTAVTSVSAVPNTNIARND
jgi:hypothetical protein